MSAVLGADFQNDFTIEMYVLAERDFIRFEFKRRFGRYFSKASIC